MVIISLSSIIIISSDHSIYHLHILISSRLFSSRYQTIHLILFPILFMNHHLYFLTFTTLSIQSMSLWKIITILILSILLQSYSYSYSYSYSFHLLFITHIETTFLFLFLFLFIIRLMIMITSVFL